MDAAKDHPGSHSPHALDYVFSHFTGIMASTVCYWLLYCVVMRARGKREKAPPCAPEAVASGVIWGIAQVRSASVAADRAWFGRAVGDARARGRGGACARAVLTISLVAPRLCGAGGLVRGERGAVL